MRPATHWWVILEYCVGGDLLALLRSDGHLPEASGKPGLGPGAATWSLLLLMRGWGWGWGTVPNLLDVCLPAWLDR